MLASGPGWIKLHRSIRSHWVWRDESAFRLWSYLLMEANFRDRKDVFENNLITFRRGQFPTSIAKIASETGLGSRVIRRLLPMLETDTMIAQQVTRKGRIITILNYDKYQSDEDLGDKQVINQVHLKRTADANEMQTKRNTLEESKEGKERKERVINKSPKPKTKTPGSQLRDAFANAYRSRYGVGPSLGLKTNAACKRIVNEYGLDESIALAEHFLKMENRFYVENCHPLGVFEKDLTKIRIDYLNRGKPKPTMRPEEDLSKGGV